MSVGDVDIDEGKNKGMLGSIKLQKKPKFENILKGCSVVSLVFGDFPPMTPSSTYCTVKKCHKIYLRTYPNPVSPFFVFSFGKG